MLTEVCSRVGSAIEFGAAVVRESDVGAQRTDRRLPTRSSTLSRIDRPYLYIHLYPIAT